MVIIALGTTQCIFQRSIVVSNSLRIKNHLPVMRSLQQAQIERGDYSPEGKASSQLKQTHHTKM